MRTFKLVEVRPESIAEAWRIAKETLGKVMNSLNDEFIRQSQLIETSCGQRCLSVKFTKSTGYEWVYLTRDGWSIHSACSTIKAESLKGDVDLRLKKVNELIQWVANLTPTDITQKIEEVL